MFMEPMLTPLLALMTRGLALKREARLHLLSGSAPYPLCRGRLLRSESRGRRRECWGQQECTVV